MADILKHLDLNSADGTQLNLDALDRKSVV